MLTLSVPHSIISFATKKKLSLLGNCVTVARQTLTLQCNLNDTVEFQHFPIYSTYRLKKSITAVKSTENVLEKILDFKSESF